MGDSIPKYVSEIPNLQNVCLRGATIGRLVDFLTFKLPEERLPLTSDIIIIHAGTNNVLKGATVYDVTSQYKVLLQSVKCFFPHATVLCSAIIPRPCDGQLSKFFVQSCNEVICILAARENVIFIPTYMVFVHAGEVKSYLYASSDLLHLNGMGLSVLTGFYRKCLQNRTKLFQHTQARAVKLSHKIKLRGYPRLP